MICNVLLQGNETIGDEGAETIAHLLTGNSELTLIELYLCLIGPTEAHHLTNSIQLKD